MKKVIIILLAIVVWSSSVKALVCVEGDCKAMGYTINVDETVPDCEAYVKCPYDTSFKTCVRYNAYPLTECPEGGDCTQSPKYRLASAEESIKFKVKVHGQVAGNLYNIVIISMNTNDYSIDWGDEGSGSDCYYYTPKTNEVCHEYNENELDKEYTITISGNVTSFKIPYSQTESLGEHEEGTIYHQADLTSIESLNLPSLVTLDNAFSTCASTLTGTIPDMSGLTNLTSAANMFAGNTNQLQLADDFALPSNLQNASDMFNGCTNLTGTINSLPSGLTNGTNMFNGCTKLAGTISSLPDGITSVSNMFTSTNIAASCLHKPAGITTTQGYVAKNSPNIYLWEDWENIATDCEDYPCSCLSNSVCQEGYFAVQSSYDINKYCENQDASNNGWSWHPLNPQYERTCPVGMAHNEDWGTSYKCSNGTEPETTISDGPSDTCTHCGTNELPVVSIIMTDPIYCVKCANITWQYEVSDDTGSSNTSSPDCYNKYIDCLISNGDHPEDCEMNASLLDNECYMIDGMYPKGAFYSYDTCKNEYDDCSIN